MEKYYNTRNRPVSRLPAEIVDYCSSVQISPPFTNGGTFTWNIPWNYRKHGYDGSDNGITFKIIPQIITATSAGDCTISKADMTTNFPASHATVIMRRQ
jgi:hypothetical protein